MKRLIPPDLVFRYEPDHGLPLVGDVPVGVPVLAHLVARAAVLHLPEVVSLVDADDREIAVSSAADALQPKNFDWCAPAVSEWSETVRAVPSAVFKTVCWSNDALYVSVGSA
ncbi:hypothetical protein [Halosimplex sp. TS25]|uniref:hypothetical protein n=1 Tax=Halosimplex rarum TaxID=3396619 RepID=UPI0039E86729